MVKIVGTLSYVHRKIYQTLANPLNQPVEQLNSAGPRETKYSGDVDVELKEGQKFHFKNTIQLVGFLNEGERVALHVYAPLLRYRRIVGVIREAGRPSWRLSSRDMVIRIAGLMLIRPLYLWIPIAIAVWFAVETLPGMAELGSLLTTARDPAQRVAAVAIQLGFIGAYASSGLSSFRMFQAWQLMMASPGID